MPVGAGIFASARVASGGGGSSVTLTSLGGDFRDASLSSYNFAAYPLGTEDASRLIIVCAATRGNNDIDSVSVAGTAATKITSTTYSTENEATIWLAAVPTGTTGDITVGATAGVSRMLMSAYAVYGASATPVGNTGTSNLGGSLSTVAGGVAIGCAVGYFSGGEAEFTWSGGIVEDVDTIADAIINFSSGYLLPTTTTTLTIGGSWSNLTSSQPSITAVSLAPL